MKIELFTSGSVEEVVDRMRSSLEKEGFIFAENERSYAADCSHDRVERAQTWSKFWTRKQLENPYPPHYSIEIDGEVVLEGERAVIRADFIEYHANRKHTYGGSRALEEYLNLFCEIFRDK